MRSAALALALAFSVTQLSCVGGLDDGPSAQESEMAQEIVTDCSQTEVDALLAPATEQDSYYELGCKVYLSAGTPMITKRVIIKGSGVILSCGGRTIDARGVPGYDPNLDTVEIASKFNSLDGTWIRPNNVQISGCNVQGSVRIYGMCRNGQDCEEQRLSSLSTGHTQRARDRAPTNVSLNNMHITGNYRIPLYLGPGVTYTSITNSTIDGVSGRGAMYLDAESAYNTIRNNSFLVDTDYDNDDSNSPVISIDGSSNNRIIDNYFSGLDKGGIYLYRNCGEGGTVRWNTPSANTIINNVFYYSSYSGSHPSVYLGSRGPGYAGYCDADEHIPYGSGVSDMDYATDNIVAQNQIYHRTTSDMIAVGYCAGNAPAYCFGVNVNNFIQYNTGSLSNHLVREAGCYRANGYPDKFVVDGASSDMEATDGRPNCAQTYVCNDGNWLLAIGSNCSIGTYGFECTASNNNSGCSGTATCPNGKHIIAALAACNLEFGSVSATELFGVAGNNLSVVRASDNASQGVCTTGTTSRSTGTGMLNGAIGNTSVGFHCHENDANGGDCNIKTQLYCR